jgi:hypothetical protein
VVRREQRSRARRTRDMKLVKRSSTRVEITPDLRIADGLGEVSAGVGLHGLHKIVQKGTFRQLTEAGVP